MWALDERLAADTFPVYEGSLCSFLLMNNRLFPWLILVPRIAGARELTDISLNERHHLMDNIAKSSDALQLVVSPHKINVAALGNQVEQLHVHVIARFKDDAAWPNPVWGGKRELYKKPPALIHQLAELLMP